MTGAVAHAEHPVGAVVLLHSWWGLTPHFRRLAERLAAAGLSTVAADLFGGSTTDDPARAREQRMAMTDEQGLDRAGAALDTARGLDVGPVSTLGFSVGAEFAIRVAADRPADVASVVAFYGVYVPEDLAALNSRVQMHVATDDEFATPDEIGEFAAAMVAQAKVLELHTYPGTRHAFFNQTRPEAYDEVAADLSWRRTLEFLGAS
jgi:carboxymethylenebutenolidase